MMVSKDFARLASNLGICYLCGKNLSIDWLWIDNEIRICIKCCVSYEGQKEITRWRILEDNN